MKILIWPAATEIGREVARALRDERGIELVGAGVRSDEVCKSTIALPHVRETDAGALLDTVFLDGIDFIYPAHDDVIDFLARHPKIPSIIGSTPEGARICRSKSATYEALRNVVSVPRIAAKWSGANDCLIDGYLDCPLFIKPDSGQGTQGTTKIETREMLPAAIAWARTVSEKVLALEYLPGPEFTIDCFSDREWGLLWHQVRERLEIRSGISVRTRAASRDMPPNTGATIYRDPLLWADIWAHDIGKALSMRGAWFFQVKLRAGGSPCLLEVAPRIGGGAPLARAQGVNLPRLSIYEALRQPVEILDQRFEGMELLRPLANRYRHKIEYDAIYIDLDDTLVRADGTVNARLAGLCVQARNRLLPITVLTRSRDRTRTDSLLAQVSGLIDYAVHIDRKASKALFIRRDNGEHPIFIDDSFAERKDVHERLGIPVFDASAAECLMDDRA